ncbi:MAG: hypothetical protein RI894_2164 [Bacteroidota bacterium]|jgi:hypothetical protein
MIKKIFCFKIENKKPKSTAFWSIIVYFFTKM